MPPSTFLATSRCLFGLCVGCEMEKDIASHSRSVMLSVSDALWTFPLLLPSARLFQAAMG